MKIKFNFWSSDEIINAYIDFIKNRNSNEIFIKYKNNSLGFKETMEGRLNVNDKTLKDLPKKVQYTYAFHFLELFQKDWKITFHLFLQKDDENENRNYVELLFDDSLKKEFYYINENNEYVYLIKQLWEIEREKLRNLDYDIKIILSEFSRNVDCESIFLFGSWAKGNATINSDIDLAVVGGNELLITKIVSEIEKKFSKKLQIHNYSGNIKKEVDNYGIRIV